MWPKPEGPHRGLSHTQLFLLPQPRGMASTLLSCPLLSPQFSPKSSPGANPCPRSEPEPPPPGGTQGCLPCPMSRHPQPGGPDSTSRQPAAPLRSLSGLGRAGREMSSGPRNPAWVSGEGGGKRGGRGGGGLFGVWPLIGCARATPLPLSPFSPRRRGGRKGNRDQPGASMSRREGSLGKGLKGQMPSARVQQGS